MKVAYLVNQYPHVSHTFIRREIAALESQGMQVARFSVRPPPHDLADHADLDEVKRTRVLLADGPLAIALSVLIKLVSAPVAWSRSLLMAVRLGRRSDRGLFRHFIYFAEACHLVRQLDGTDHLHAHFGTNPATVAMLARVLGGPPYSFTVHGPEEFDKPEAIALGAKIAHSQFTVAISSFGRSQLCRWCRVEEWKKLQVVRCGVDSAFLGPEPTPVPDVQTVVCVGRLSEQKGQVILLQALARLREQFPSLRVVFAGDGPLRGLIEQTCDDLGIRDRVTITGWASNSRVRDELRAARALVLPSFAEGLPVVLMEAFALGRPAVSTYVAGIPELVRPGENGWLVPAGDADALAGAMAELLMTPVERLTEMGRTGRRAVQDRHDVNREATRLAEFFRK
ncbi:MAG: glycosyltransferase family 4 protein [Gemmataceae bacterium]|nr:glycosyltransferase family 4 protein [Gemmataceae bacterium]